MNKTASHNTKSVAESLIVALLLSILILALSPALKLIDLYLHDNFVGWAGENRSQEASTDKVGDSDKIVLVIIDDDSILSIPGLFQGNRSVFARALNFINGGSPKGIGLDVFFPSPSTDNPSGDEELIKAVRQSGRTVLRAYQRDNKRITPPFPALARSGITAPVFFSSFRDGLTRCTSLAFKTESGVITPSFHLELFRLFLNADANEVAFSESQLYIKTDGREFTAPLFNGQNSIINFSKSISSFKTVPFSAVYNQTVNSEMFNDKLVLIGYANSMTEEKFRTPLHGVTYSPFLNAMVVKNLLEGKMIQAPSAYQGRILGIFLLFVFSIFVFPAISLLTSFILSTLAAAGLGFLAFHFLQHSSQMIDIVPSIFAIYSGLGVFATRQYMLVHKEKSRIKNAFQHYVTASVVNEILKNPEKLNLHGEERDLTIFFSDIEGFTTLSEGMSPLDVVSLLNEYLSEMTEIIFKFDGLLDKYEGDAIMAVFGAPVDQKDHAIRACKCALENQKALSRLREKWKAEGKPEIKARIGINTGLVVVGNMGSKMRFDYTVIGDNVNLAARLETANKVTFTEILVSEETAMLAEEAIVSRCLGKLKVAGKVNMVKVFEVLASKTEESKSLTERAIAYKEAYEAASDFVSARKFSEAKTILEKHLEQYPEDRPAQNLLTKAKGFLIVPPPPSWENIITQENK